MTLLWSARTPNKEPNPYYEKILSGKRVLVCGASTGTGRDLAKLYAMHGCFVVLTAPTLAELEPALADCRGIRRATRDHKARRKSVDSNVWMTPDEVAVVGLAFNAMDPGAAESCVLEAVKAFNGIGGSEANGTRNSAGLDILVLMHTISAYYRFLSVPADKAVRDLERLTRVNYISYVELTIHALPYLRRAGEERAKSAKGGAKAWVRSQILTVSSMSAKAPQPCTYAYAASKAAVTSMFSLIHTELANHPRYRDFISQTTIHYGAIKSQAYLDATRTKFPLLLSRGGAVEVQDAAWAALKAGCSGKVDITYPESNALIGVLWAIGMKKTAVSVTGWAHGGVKTSFGPAEGEEDPVTE
ncbi:hypothetical protein HDU93_000692 [Gonapodya sp. JEL0774]|nr:hypothetical protein HDU93_000692 [Gonapodya sp. JEL0774]